MPRPRPSPVGGLDRSVVGGLLALALALPGCAGEIGDPEGTSAGPDAEGTPPVEDGTPPAFDPFEGGGVTIGTVCGPSGVETRVVFSAGPATCADHARLLALDVFDEDAAVVTAPDVRGPTRIDAMGELCLDGACAERPFRIEIDVFGPDLVRGRWTADTARGPVAGNLQAEVCDYQGLLPGSEPAKVPHLAVSEVAFYQGIKIPLYRDGAEVEVRSVPVIEGRPALLRVFVAPRPGYVPQEVTAELTWRRDAASEPSRREATASVTEASRDGSRASTFDFELEASDVTPDARWAVTLRSPGACPADPTLTREATAPATGALDLDPRPVGPFRVVLVPIQYEADGSGRLPDISEEQLELYRRKIYGMYPVPELDLRVRNAVVWERPVAPDGRGWSELLSALLGLRAQDDPPANTFYYGIFAPAESQRAFCSPGCVAGLGPLPSPEDELRRGAIGLGFSGQGIAATAAHELGHANGRQHAPCGVGGADRDYPHPEASIGEWGYDITNGSLKNPTTFKDVMSYCDPDWISDYNYAAIYERLAFVNQVQPLFVGGPSSWRLITFALEGATWGESFSLDRPPVGDPVEVRYFDATGRLLAVETGVEFGLDHLDDTIAAIPVAPPQTYGVEIGTHPLVEY